MDSSFTALKREHFWFDNVFRESKILHIHWRASWVLHRTSKQRKILFNNGHFLSTRESLTTACYTSLHHAPLLVGIKCNANEHVQIWVSCFWHFSASSLTGACKNSQLKTFSIGRVPCATSGLTSTYHLKSTVGVNNPHCVHKHTLFLGSHNSDSMHRWQVIINNKKMHALNIDPKR